MFSHLAWDCYLDRKHTFQKSLSSTDYFSYPKSIPCKTPAPSSLPLIAVEKTILSSIFFFSATGFQEHLKVLKSPAPGFCQFFSKLRLLQLFHFSHWCALFLTLCKKRHDTGVLARMLRAFPPWVISRTQSCDFERFSPASGMNWPQQQLCSTDAFTPLSSVAGFQAMEQSRRSLIVLTAPTWLPLLLLPRSEQEKQMENTFFVCSSCSTLQLCLINYLDKWDG